MTQPASVMVKAIDVKPYRYALWCTVGGCKEPFANEIVCRRWAPDGSHIEFMLDSHNFFGARPYEEIELIPHMPTPPYAVDFLARVDLEDELSMAKRPAKTGEART